MQQLIIIITVQLLFREKKLPNNRTDIDIVVVVLRSNYLKADNKRYKNKRLNMNLFYA